MARSFFEAERIAKDPETGEMITLRVNFDLDAVVVYKERPDGLARVILDTDAIIDLALTYDEFREVYVGHLEEEARMEDEDVSYTERVQGSYRPSWLDLFPVARANTHPAFPDVPDTTKVSVSGDSHPGGAATAGLTIVPDPPVEHFVDPVDPDKVVEELRESGYSEDEIAIRLSDEVLAEPEERIHPEGARVIIDDENSHYFGDHGKVIGVSVNEPDVRLVRIDDLSGFKQIRVGVADLVSEE